jgi:hypothetical protein
MPEKILKSMASAGMLELSKVGCDQRVFDEKARVFYANVRVFDANARVFEANAFISPFNTQTKYFVCVILYTTALLCFPKNFMPWRDSNPGLLVPEAGVISTAPCRQDKRMRFSARGCGAVAETFLSDRQNSLPRQRSVATSAFSMKTHAFFSARGRGAVAETSLSERQNSLPRKMLFELPTCFNFLNA